MALSPVSTTVAGSAFTEFADSVLPPLLPSAAYYGLYGKDDATALANLATGGVATKVGTITHDASGYSTFTRDAGIDTGVSFIMPFTMGAVCGRVPAGSPSGQSIMGPYQQSPGDGSNRQSVLVDSFNGTTGNIFLFENFVAGQVQAPLAPGVGGSDYNFLFAQFDGATMAVGYGYTDADGNQQIAASYLPFTYTPAGYNLRIGANGYGGAVLPVRYAAAFGAKSVLTTADLCAEYAYHKKRMASLGLTLN